MLLSVLLNSSPTQNLILVRHIGYLAMKQDLTCPFFLGACDKIHNDRLKERYQKVQDKSKYPYEAEFYDYLNKLISDLSRKIRQGNGRLNIQLDDKVK